MEAMEVIQQRISVRSYKEKPVEESVRQELATFCRGISTGSFGEAVRFELLDLEPLSREELKPLGTYGVIKGASLYILGAMKEGERAFEDLGYCFEKIILKATELGLGTCWLGGSLKRGAFAAKMKLQDDELLPAITPVGYPAESVSAVDRWVRFSGGSKSRKPWPELFFSADGQTPLSEADAGGYRDSLEAVRMGPSASNRQPWRIIKDQEGRFNLYLKENKIYNRLLGKIRIQSIDMGIALCHFEMVAHERGLPGKWTADGRTDIAGLKYVATWTD